MIFFAVSCRGAAALVHSSMYLILPCYGLTDVFVALVKSKVMNVSVRSPSGSHEFSAFKLNISVIFVVLTK